VHHKCATGCHEGSGAHPQWKLDTHTLPYYLVHDCTQLNNLLCIEIKTMNITSLGAEDEREGASGQCQVLPGDVALLEGELAGAEVVP